jgi:hypothetical protein
MLRVCLAAAAACVLASPLPARAFCGFYVGSADGTLVNEATMVVMLRDGTDTVLSMRNDYRGPPEDFAMVVPVPEVIGEEDVKVLPAAIFETVERLAAPRLVEYWEQDPCAMGGGGTGESFGFGGLGLRGTGRGGGGTGAAPVVTVEAEFEVGEYDIVILSARDSAGLEEWLVANDYRIPEGAAELLRPYVESESKFFVAKVNVDRVTFEDGRAVLSPLRVHYQSESFSLPVRLGLLSSGEGKQDLIVHILADDQRYELANYENVTIPTNVEVAPGARDRFGEFYAALFDETLASHPNAVVTEYAWTASSCDPCPGPSLTAQNIATLGGDVVHDGPIRISGGGGGTIGLGNLGTIGRPGGSFGTTGGGSTANRRVARVRSGTTTVRGEGLSREVVRRIIRRHINEVRFCYETQLRSQPGLEGRAELELVIDSHGRVTESSVEGGTLNDDSVEGCLAAAGRRWAFPAFLETSREPITATHDLLFTAEGSRPPPPPRPTFGFFGGGAGPFNGYVLTRLHYRYDEDDLGEDLVFREADPIEGGREHTLSSHRAVDDPSPEGAHPAPTNNFQGRYIIRHEWEGAIECDEPRRGVWGGRPNPPSDEGAERGALGALLGSGSAAVAPPVAATNLAQAPRGDASVLEELITARGGNAQAAESEPEAATQEPADEEPAEATPAAESEDSGCGCRVVGANPADAPLALLALLGLAIAWRRRGGAPRSMSAPAPENRSA